MDFYVCQKKVSLGSAVSFANLFPEWIVMLVRSLMLAHIKITIWSSKTLLIILRKVTNAAGTKLKQHHQY